MTRRRVELALSFVLIPFALVGYAVVFVIVVLACLWMDFEEWLTK